MDYRKRPGYQPVKQRSVGLSPALWAEIGLLAKTARMSRWQFMRLVLRRHAREVAESLKTV